MAAQMYLENNAEGVGQFQPRVRAQREPWVPIRTMRKTLKGFPARGTLSGFCIIFGFEIPELALRANSGLKLANAFGVIYLQVTGWLLFHRWARACSGVRGTG